MWKEGSATSPWGFTGERWDETANLLYLRARWYAPQNGIFLSRDPVRENHPYQYANGNPVTYIDPDGRNPLVIIAIIGAIIFFSQIPSDQYQPDPVNWGNPYVQLFGLSLMCAPSLGPLFCLNDGDCTNEANIVTQPYVRETLPKLEGTFAEAFADTPVTRILQPGTLLYRAEAAAAQGPGYWFGTQATQYAATADRWWNVTKWGNPREVLRIYEVLQEVTVYYGKVAEGRGTQILVPRGIPLDEVLRRVGEVILK